MQTTYKDECGCVSDEAHWLKMCPVHRAEADEISARWVEYRRVKAERLNTSIEDLL